MSRVGVLLAVAIVAATANGAAGRGLTSRAIERAAVSRPIRAGSGIQPAVVKAEVLLDRRHLSPGVIDGRYGTNFKKALKAFQALHGRQVTGILDRATWERLTADRSGPILKTFAIQKQNVRGPFLKRSPHDLRKMGAAKSLGYTSPIELLAEKFHASPQLLKRLNPGADFAHARGRILVPNAGTTAATKAALVVVDRKNRVVKVYDRRKDLIGLYPATVGSRDFPSPSGRLKVTVIQQHPRFMASGRLEYARKSAKLQLQPGERIEVAAGPNGPVGDVWIGLNKHGYGIHGTAEPEAVGKTASHGCVRMSVPSVISLYERARIGTPVLVR